METWTEPRSHAAGNSLRRSSWELGRAQSANHLCAIQFPHVPIPSGREYSVLQEHKFVERYSSRLSPISRARARDDR